MTASPWKETFLSYHHDGRVSLPAFPSTSFIARIARDSLIVKVVGFCFLNRDLRLA